METFLHKSDSPRLTTKTVTGVNLSNHKEIYTNNPTEAYIFTTSQYFTFNYPDNRCHDGNPNCKRNSPLSNFSGMF